MPPDITSLLNVDPSLPTTNPTTPYWLQPPHHLANAQSAHLPNTQDIVIIGSGITAASLALTLLRKDPTCTITLLEARTLCSGATGRNGGHLVTYGGASYSALKELVGSEQAIKVIDYTFKNIERTRELVSEFGGLEVEFRDVTRLRMFGSEQLHAAKESVAAYERDRGSMKGQYTFIDKEEARERYGVNNANVTGVGVIRASALWPYRLITRIYDHLVCTYPSRFTLETNTPALSIEYNATTFPSHPYTIATPRGTIRSTKVIHCTNGYAGHLLPLLRGALYPNRGTMTVQDLGDRLPNHGQNTSWSLHSAPQTRSGKVDSGMCYLQQNALTGYFFIGGEKRTMEEAITSNDSEHNESSVLHLQDKLPRLFGLHPSKGDRLVSTWTGIMGYTADGLPLVGRLSSPITGRMGDGEYIAAGFNGMGMSMCILAGEAIAQMIVGGDITKWFPEAFEISTERLRERLNAGISVAKS
ncbi:FAD dependent oxidoreductase [Amniculicola lignicola CBS 123094]|uniref:FAD dependent oxidoreductase n=1 Tax=Amniculicola lignicola CBS 123094 TaxID=1392246 RepID=A0A6A5WJM3_9PLEO|nr:FAD dependent oxidoreductase [Amniculicola lignicola CBS 123094]